MLENFIFVCICMFTCEHIAKLQSNVCALITHALLLHRCWGSSLVQVGDALQGGYNVFHGYVSVAITYTLSQVHHQHYAYYIIHACLSCSIAK